MAGIEVNEPVTLSKALASTNVLPGDTLLLRAGTYQKDKIICSISGSADNYITIKPYNRERVIIDGQMTITGQYIRVVGLESMYGKWRNRAAGETTGTVGFDCLNHHIDIINCLIHDHDQGITTSKVYTDHNYYGNLVYFNGWNTALGHGMYPQNDAGNTKTIKHNAVFDNFGYGIHCYGSAGSVSDFVIDGNTVFENGRPISAQLSNILNGSSIGTANPVFRNNMTYTIPDGVTDGRVQIGYGDGNAVTNVQVYDNYLIAPRECLKFMGDPLEITRMNGNTIVGWVEGISTTDYPDNAYITSYPNDTPYPSTGSHIALMPNEYDADRANLTIYNWDLANTVTVDVSALGWTGQLTARNVQDYWNDVQNLTITDGSITVNMQAVNRTVAAPVAWEAPASTFPQFGCFVLERQ